MATPTSAAAMYDAVRDHVKVRTHGEWRSHNRGNRGTGWGPVNGVMIHHYGPYSTVSGAISYARTGSSDLPGPLYAAIVDRSGVVHLLGWGRCNHAGRGDGDVLDHVIREDYPLPEPNRNTVDGNSRFYGICLLNKGKTADYPAKQLRAGAAVAALLCGGHTGWTERSVIGHKEWQDGKPDPIGSMDSFRKRVRGYLRDGVPDLRTTTDPPKDCGCNCTCDHDR